MNILAKGNVFCSSAGSAKKAPPQIYCKTMLRTLQKVESKPEFTYIGLGYFEKMIKGPSFKNLRVQEKSFTEILQDSIELKSGGLSLVHNCFSP
jgi:hypothetical protein